MTAILHGHEATICGTLVVSMALVKNSSRKPIRIVNIAEKNMNE